MASSSYLVIDPNLALNLKPHPDNYVINSESGYDISIVRKLINWTYHKPFNREYKLTLIAQAENLSTEAQNTLLKVLEEPAENNYLFLTTQSADLILPTIRSRCAQTTIQQIKNRELNHLPKDPEWVDNFTYDGNISEQEVLNFPKITNEIEAFKEAETLAKKTRDEVENLLEKWIHDLGKTDMQTSYLIVEELLNAKEKLKHNTNVQLTLEVMFLTIAKTNK